jgi:hypothetical protein
MFCFSSESKREDLVFWNIFTGLDILLAINTVIIGQQQYLTSVFLPKTIASFKKFRENSAVKMIQFLHWMLSL